MNKIKTVLIDSQESSLARFKDLLTKFNEVELLATFEDSKEGLDFILKNELDLAFVQIEMPNISGLELAEEVSKRGTDVKIVLVSAHSHYAIKALKASVFDYLLKPISIDELKISLQRFNTKYKINLNSRELQIIREMSNGLSSQNIGEKLFISRHTVDTYRRSILEKSDCQNTAQLIKFALKSGLI
ncbi:response regulator transcription factor [Polaribacter ponticola]|uniref:Response regulator transcription factor n=1 Tax=Polaribacter ponticola TaxID=2978475 RepID=A0ABT5SCT6_9FLAO|nr:response regulator transcription factor [Polaribacter sp. MSW5]MDD7915888.1 response regulator transcription factor [Polaribacter sp. MSW5]